MEKQSGIPYLTTRQAAEELGVSLRTAQNWVERGLLEAWKTEGGHRRITRESVNRLKANTPPEELPPTDDGFSNRLKVLIIEDDMLLMRLYKIKLESSVLPLDIITAPNAIEGLLLLGRESPDLLITDVLMPGLDGYTMVKILCKSPFREGVEIIICTGTPISEAEEHPDLPSDVTVLSKPVPFPEIERICERLLERRRALLRPAT